MEKQISEILKKMTLQEKISLCNGASFWESKAMDAYGIPSITMSDGPNGVRFQKKETDMIGVNNAEPATCFPAAVTSGASWDSSLLEEEGQAIGEEALHYGIDVMLGPGVNIKRNPLCGRNFEYFSEDPYIAGSMGKAWVQGVQSTGEGTSLKHFAANNQEYKRFGGNSQVDLRTLRELYLPAFEKVVKEASPETVMCSYPRINNVHASDNHWLLTRVLRRDWGFQGMVVTDWGALCNRVKAMHAGCDLSMPGGSDYMEDWVLKAVENGTLAESDVDACAGRVIALALKSPARKKGQAFDQEAHNRVARKVAEGGAVLLKNEDRILPLKKDARIALIGEMARTPRYQGAGSSHINPSRLTSLLDAMPEADFVPGCDKNGDVTEESLAGAREAAAKADTAIVCAGLPDLYESEGFDRDNIRMPEGHIRLIEGVAAANPNTVVVLFSGSVVEIPWIDRVKAVLYMGLPGQAGGAAAANLLMGRCNPSGKLTETWPLSYEDVPSRDTFGKKTTHYKEGLYVGYRYYEKAGKKVRFPFGYGLSYTRFSYKDLKIRGRTVSAVITNEGDCTGAEIVQLYVAAPQDGLYRPLKELKGFAKVMLAPGESRKVEFTLDERSFAIWWEDGWHVPAGRYEILLGASSADIRLQDSMKIEGEKIEAPAWQKNSWYETLRGLPSDAEFEALYGGPLQEDLPIEKGNFTMEHSLMELKDHSRIMEKMFHATEKTIAKSFGGKIDYEDPTFKMTILSGADCSLRAAVLDSCGALPGKVAETMLAAANGKPLEALGKIFAK